MEITMKNGVVYINKPIIAKYDEILAISKSKHLSIYYEGEKVAEQDMDNEIKDISILCKMCTVVILILCDNGKVYNLTIDITPYYGTYEDTTLIPDRIKKSILRIEEIKEYEDENEIDYKYVKMLVGTDSDYDCSEIDENDYETGHKSAYLFTEDNCVKEYCPNGIDYPLNSVDIYDITIDETIKFGKTNWDIFHKIRKLKDFADIGEMVHLRCREVTSTLTNIELSYLTTTKQYKECSCYLEYESFHSIKIDRIIDINQ